MHLLSFLLALAMGLVLALSSCAVQEEKAAAPAKAPPVMEAKAPPPAAEAKTKPTEQAPPAKAKPIKAKGDVGLLDLEKNYMILVTKEGKLITLDFGAKTKVTQITPTQTKIEDIGLGSSATVEYQTKDDKNVATVIQYKAAKGGE